jgi:hypothetical protein
VSLAVGGASDRRTAQFHRQHKNVMSAATSATVVNSALPRGNLTQTRKTFETPFQSRTERGYFLGGLSDLPEFQSSKPGLMVRVPWKHTSPAEPFCALIMPQGLITWYSPRTRAPFSGPSVTTPRITAVPLRLF